jgi:mannose-6-phosphate isomerase-like protein (cupin superfamily)
MIVHDLGPNAVAGFERVDLATATEEPPSPIGYFEFHGCVCGVASFTGRPPWELHTAGDEMLHVLDGSCVLTVHEPTGDTRSMLRAGDVVIVPQGCWHSNDAPDGVTLFFLTPKDGNEHSWDAPPRDPSVTR